MKPPTNAQLAAMNREQLAVCYLHWVGYDPFVDSPSISPKEVRDTLIGYFAEMAKAPCAPRPGWTLQETGGHCTALMRVVTDTDLEWLITQDDDPSAPTNPDEPCTLGLYMRGDTVLIWHCSCLAEALQIAEGAKTL